MNSGDYSGITTQIEVRRNFCNQINYLEHVVVTVQIQHPVRGDLQLILKSPSNTPSTLLDFRPKDTNTGGLGITRPHSNGWSMNTVRNWGERPHGLWTLTVNDRTILNDEGFKAEPLSRKPRNAETQKPRKLLRWRLQLFGTSEPLSRKPRNAETQKPRKL